MKNITEGSIKDEYEKELLERRHSELINKKENIQLLIGSIVGLITILLLTYLDIFYVPNDSNIGFMLNLLQIILAVFGISLLMFLIFAWKNALSKTGYTILTIYILLIIILVGIIVLRMGNFQIIEVHKFLK